MHETTNQRLRRRLQEITRIQEISRHPALLRDLMPLSRHSIQVADSKWELSQYTCLMHVFDFPEQPVYVAIAQYGLGAVYAGPTFAHWLIDHGALVEIPGAAPKSIVFYFDEGKFRHAGIMVSNTRLTSKWGIGQLYEHELFEVPTSYGSDLRFFRPIPVDKALSYFKRFAWENGVPMGEAFKNEDSAEYEE